MILNMEAESFLETSLSNYQSAQGHISQVRSLRYKIICLPFCPIFISCDVTTSSQSLKIEAPEGSTKRQCNVSLILCHSDPRDVEHSV